MTDQRDIRELGVRTGTHSAMSDALERRRRENEEADHRRRAHQRLYEAQFRRPVGPPINKEASLKATRRWLDRAFGRLREKPREITRRSSLHGELTPERVFRSPGVRQIRTPAVMTPRNHAEIAPWILDAETLETAYALDDMTLPTWSTDPYSNLWSSVGLILSDDDFQHVRPFNSFLSSLS